MFRTAFVLLVVSDLFFVARGVGLNMTGSSLTTFNFVLGQESLKYEITEEMLYVPGSATDTSIRVSSGVEKGNPRRHFYIDDLTGGSRHVMNLIVACDGSEPGVRVFAAVQIEDMLPEGCWLQVISDPGFKQLRSYYSIKDTDSRSAGFWSINDVTKEEFKLRWSIKKATPAISTADAKTGKGALPATIISYSSLILVLIAIFLV